MQRTVVMGSSPQRPIFPTNFGGFFVQSMYVCNQFFIVPVNDLIIEYTIRLKDPSEQNDIISLPTLPCPSESGGIKKKREKKRNGIKTRQIREKLQSQNHALKRAHY